MKALFPMLNKKHNMDTRLNMKFHINKAKSQKYKFSAVPRTDAKNAESKL